MLVRPVFKKAFAKARSEKGTLKPKMFGRLAQADDYWPTALGFLSV
jgi:hypothetical protein